jgi:hypothetical protein
LPCTSRRLPNSARRCARSCGLDCPVFSRSFTCTRTRARVDEAIAYAGAGEHPLSSYWYGSDSAAFQRFLRNTTSGAVSRNDFGLAYLNHAAPFGGVGMSGSGAYHGKAGFDTFSRQRPVAQSDLPVAIAARSFRRWRKRGLRVWQWRRRRQRRPLFEELTQPTRRNVNGPRS